MKITVIAVAGLALFNSLVAKAKENEKMVEKNETDGIEILDPFLNPEDEVSFIM